MTSGNAPEPALIITKSGKTDRIPGKRACEIANPDACMIKSDLIKRITEQNPHLYQRDIEAIVNAILDTITAALKRGNRVELRGFGAFGVKKREARIGGDPRNGEEVAVSETVVPTLKTSQGMHHQPPLKEDRPCGCSHRTMRSMGGGGLYPRTTVQPCNHSGNGRTSSSPGSGSPITRRVSGSGVLLGSGALGD